MTFTIYHNPDCGTSRNTLALIRQTGIEPRVIEYLKTPPIREELQSLLKRADLSVRDMLRKKGTPYTALGLDNPELSDDSLLDAMMEHPILINRPIVVTDKGVNLCRPSDIVLDLLPPFLAEEFLKEERVPFLRDYPVAGNDQDLVSTLTAAGLPIDDLEDPNRTFFAYRTLCGRLVGFGGFELCGLDVLIRSIAVAPDTQRRGIGKNLLPILLYRAFRHGARRAWLLTNSAAGFFEKIGFKRVAREDAPAMILATRQAASCCCASATLMTRTIGI